MRNPKFIRVLLFIFTSLSFMKIAAQSIEIDWIELVGNKVIVHYNLNDNTTNRQYAVNLLVSRDNFTSPLTHVTGDVGTEVKPGSDRKIVWDITNELGNFKGELSFEVQGRIYVPLVKLIDFEKGRVFKRGRSYPITWTSGNLNGLVNIELMNDKQVHIKGDNNQPNNGKYDFDIPISTKIGSDYRLKFTNAKDRSDIQYSAPFAIKPKIPSLVKAGVALLVGGGIIALTTMASKDGISTTETPLTEWPGTP